MRLKLINAFVLICLCFQIQLYAQTIPPTGSNPPGGTLPAGWVDVGAFSTCDVSDVNGWRGLLAWSWEGIVSLPPSGDNTWINGFAGSGLESVKATITGLTIGSPYTFTFYAAELRNKAGVISGVPDNSYDGVLRLFNASTNAVLQMYSFSGGSSNAWNTWSYIFTPTSSTLDIGFTYDVDPGANGNTWNISLISPPLPIELIEFNAMLNEVNHVGLSWVTASEINNDYFVVERSKNAVDFEVLGEKINGGGSSSQILRYYDTDFSPYTGISYYRLKQVDFNGNFSYSGIQTINYHPLNCELLYYPNPSPGVINFVNYQDGVPIDVSILSVTGIIVERIKVLGRKQLNIASGVYYLRYQ
ncbi:MAG: T9SS type A sorting domain-containing protein, partial [Flavobacteriales bacterium]|nr:T9SS type A sorting domain-containing protein [Flavobacteriales bacterium]